MKQFEGENLLVIGGTSAFGQTFVRLALNEFNLNRIVVYSRNELKQFEMAQAFADSRVSFCIGDVRDRERLYEAMRNIDLVVYAAGLRQVSTADCHPSEAIKTNIQGAINVIDTAIARGVHKVIVLSTEKAAHPVYLHGVPQMVAENLLITANLVCDSQRTRFSVVRYGKIVASGGSVIPLFAKQRRLGTLSMTHAETTRFWITINEGTRFVARCLATMHGGEIFVPKMPTARIIDLAKVMAPDCRIEIVGFKPGEKLHEVLITEDEANRTLEFDDFFVIKPQANDWHEGAWQGGRPLPSEFRYASDVNPWTLSVAQIRGLLEGLGFGNTDSV